MSDALLTARDIHTYYGKIVALRGVDIDVNRGEIVTMIGANGAGKSTLMMTICRTSPHAQRMRSCGWGLPNRLRAGGFFRR